MVLNGSLIFSGLWKFLGRKKAQLEIEKANKVLQPSAETGG
jgi:hypothetical protein